MAIVGIVFVILGVAGTIWGIFQKHKAGRPAQTPFARTGHVATRGNAPVGKNGAISVEGDVKCAAPVISPVTGMPCLYYEVKIVGSWKEEDEGKTKDYLAEKKAAAFAVDDGSGAIGVVADQGGDYEPFEKSFEETKKGKGLTERKNAFGKGQSIQFGKLAFAKPPMSKADTFTCTEHVMKVQPRLFVLGKYEGGVIGSPGRASLILSRKTREQLVGSTATSARRFLIGGPSAAALGAILGIVSNLFTPAAPTASASPALFATPAAAPADPKDAPSAPEVAAPADPKARASQAECERFTDKLYQGIKVPPSQRRREIDKCSEQLTSAQLTCILAAPSDAELKKCAHAK